MKMTEKMFIEYQTNPLEMDSKVREHFKLPENKYYTVAIWPEHVKGEVRVINLSRQVKSAKISKSDQQ